MAVNDTITTLKVTVGRGAFPAIAPAVGRIASTTLSTDLAPAANDVIQIFTFEDDTIVLAAWVEVVTATTGASNISLGKADGAECMAATAIGSTGLKFDMTGKVPVLFAAADTFDAHFSADASGGDIIVRVLMMDAEDLGGAA